MKELLTFKEYAKNEGISYQAVEKRVKSKLIESVELDQKYIVFDSKKDDLIKDLRKQIKFKNTEIRSLKNELKYFNDQRERITALELKLEEQRDKKEELYEKMIGTFLQLPQK